MTDILYILIVLIVAMSAILINVLRHDRHDHGLFERYMHDRSGHAHHGL